MAETRVSDERLKELLANTSGYESFPAQSTITDISNALKELQELRAQSSWVKVSERLPEGGSLVLTRCTYPGGIREVTAILSYGEYEFCNPIDEETLPDADNEGIAHRFGWWDERENSGGDFDYIITEMNGRVKHWMELPAAPKEGENNGQ